MKLTPEQELENSLVKVNYHKICDLFGLSENERLNPNCGEWIVDCIKQYQTTYVITKSMKMRGNENQSVENYRPPSTPLPQINPLLKETTEIPTIS